MPALTFLADAIDDRNANVLEVDAIQMMNAIERNNRLDGNSCGRHVCTDETDSLLFSWVLRRARQTEYPVGPLRVGGPNLCTVQNVLIAVTNRLKAKTRQIRARLRLRVPLRPH